MGKLATLFGRRGKSATDASGTSRGEIEHSAPHLLPYLTLSSSKFNLLLTSRESMLSQDVSRRTPFAYTALCKESFELPCAFFDTTYRSSPR